MAVDRGGLRYNIKLGDQFSKTAAKFRKDMRSSKDAFKALKDSAAEIGKSARGFKAGTAAVDEQSKALKNLAEQSKRQRAVEREAVRIRNTQQRDAARRARELSAAERKATQERAQAAREEQRRIRENLAAQKRAAREANKIAEAQRRDQARSLLEQQRQVKNAIDNQNAREREARRIGASMRRDEARNLLEQQRQLKAFADARARQEKESARIAKSLARDKARELKQRQALDPEFQAQRRINNGLREELIQRKQISLLRNQAKTQFSTGDILGGARTLRQAREVERSLKSVNREGNNILFTFRRLIGVLAAFTIARNVAQGFAQMVAAGVRFNDTVEGSTTAIAGLLVATADVRDALGQSVEPAQELDLAFVAAREQVRKLRQDALKTVATFEQLLSTFQIAVAPGFAAGLNIDEIRKLTVSISQAASAIGLEQNQLAEEVRSLLSGTIQARTTRIATALGITNSDIRRLRETGELFTFLEDRFSAFALSAERQARSTVTGIRTLIEGATTELLGEAARPLFDELLLLGNQFFDQVLTIVDAQGDLKPNPEIVAAFREIFNALRDGVTAIREAAERLGFEGLQNTLRGVGTALVVGIRFALGFAETLLFTLNAIVGTLTTISDLFGISNQAAGRIAGAIGVASAATLIWNNTLGALGLNLSSIAAISKKIGPILLNIAKGPVGAIGAALGIVLLGFNKIAESIFNVDLGLKETIELLAVGFIGTLFDALVAVRDLGLRIKNSLSEVFQSAIEGAIDLADELRILAAAASGDGKEVELITAERDQRNLDQENAARKRRKDFELELADIRRDADAKSLGINEEISRILGDAVKRGNEGVGFDSKFDVDAFLKAQKLASEGGTDFTAIISSADSAIQAMAESLKDLEDELFKAGAQLQEARRVGGLEGIGGQIEGVFSAEAVANAERLRKLRASLKEVETSIATTLEEQGISAERLAAIQTAASGDVKGRRAALAALNLTRAEAQLVSLLRDQTDIRESLSVVEQKSLDLAVRKAAIIAVQETPAIINEVSLLRRQLQAEQNITNALVNRLAPRRQAINDAQAALDLAREEAQIANTSSANQIAALQARAAAAGSGSERDDIQALIDALIRRQTLEQSISAEKIKQLETLRNEAALIESGTISQGLGRGLEQVLADLPTAFEAGIQLVRSMVDSLTNYISSEIVAAFDPNNNSDEVEERFGRFLQSIANLLLQQVIQLAIAAMLQKLLGESQAAAVEVTAATTASSIRLLGAQNAAAVEIAAAQTAATIRAASGGFHAGGLVKGFHTGGRVSQRGAASPAHLLAQGLAAGGFPRPAGLHPADTVPAWLQPGEFVIRKSVVDSLGAGFFQAVNAGRFAAPSATPDSGQAASAGMASGGLVSDQIQRALLSSSSNGSSQEAQTQIVPAVVAGERELSRMLAGGRSAGRQYLLDNAGLIQSIARGR